MLPIDFDAMALAGINKNLPDVWIVKRTGTMRLACLTSTSGSC